MSNNQIRELRKSQHMSQDQLASLLGISQQTVSSIERGGRDIPTDILCKLSQMFNVTTDYIIGLSPVKRDLTREARMNSEMDQYYSVVLGCQRLDPVDRRTIAVVLDRLIQAQLERDAQKGEAGDHDQSGNL